MATIHSATLTSETFDRLLAFFFDLTCVHLFNSRYEVPFDSGGGMAPFRRLTCNDGRINRGGFNFDALRNSTNFSRGGFALICLFDSQGECLP
jgi:hypothetical protein